MPYLHAEAEWPDIDPAPTVATIEEMAIADELRRALELKYLGSGSSSLDPRLMPEAPGLFDDVD